MSDGASIALEEGAGPSVLLVHGTATTRRSWASVAPLLQSSFRTYAMDRRGRGDSTDGPTYSFAREAEDIARVAESLPTPVHVLAHSYGALCAFEVLLSTDRIKRVVLCEPLSPVAGGMARLSPDALCAAVAAGDNDRAMLMFLKDYAQFPAPVIETYRADADLFEYCEGLRATGLIRLEWKEQSTSF